MAENAMGTWGRRIFLAIFFPMFAYAIWATFAQHGIPGWINDFQSNLLDGRYYPKLTMVLMIFPALAIAYPVALATDWLTGDGIFRAQQTAPPPLPPDF